MRRLPRSKSATRAPHSSAASTTTCSVRRRFATSRICIKSLHEKGYGSLPIHAMDTEKTSTWQGGLKATILTSINPYSRHQNECTWDSRIFKPGSTALNAMRALFELVSSTGSSLLNQCRNWPKGTKIDPEITFFFITTWYLVGGGSYAMQGQSERQV